MKDYENIDPGTISMLRFLQNAKKSIIGVVAVGFVVENNEEFLIVKNTWEQHGVIKNISKFLPKHCGILEYGCYLFFKKIHHSLNKNVNIFLSM